MTFEISLGWWMVPLALTIAVWLPSLRHRPVPSSYLPDVSGIIIWLASISATMFLWMVYFAIGWAVS